MPRPLLITPDQVREHNPHLLAAPVPTMEALIRRADACMAIYCGWPRSPVGFTLTRQTYTTFVEPWCDDPRTADLPHPMVTSGILHIDPGWGRDFALAYPAGTLIPAGAILFEDSRILLNSSYRFSPVKRANRVQYVAGFPVPTEAEPELERDEDIVAQTAATVRHLIDMRRNQSTTNVSAAGESATLADSDAMVPASVRNFLVPWINWRSRVG